MRQLGVSRPPQSRRRHAPGGPGAGRRAPVSGTAGTPVSSPPAESRLFEAACALSILRPALDRASHELVEMAAEVEDGTSPKLLFAVAGLLDRMNLGVGEILSSLEAENPAWGVELAKVSAGPET